MSALRSIAMTPVWMLQVFGMSKSFRDNPIIGSEVLNRLGLHAARLVAAHGMRKFRSLFIAPMVTPAQRDELARNGFIFVENFLPEEDFTRLQQEVRSARGEVRECIQGDTLTHRILLDDETLAGMPGCKALIDNKRFLRPLQYVAASLKRPLFYIQSIKNGFAEGASDPQKVLHADTFHPTMKAWYFMEDVPLDKGPFTYVRGSHRLTWKRLKWEYQRSCRAATLKDGYSEKGSMRAEPADLEVLGLPPAEALAVKKNTLVVADTHGFHCRGQAKPGMSRLEIWAYSRTNPFNPFPGIGSRAFSRLENKLARAYWRWEDDRAAKRNRQSSWHLVPTEKMFDN